MHVDQKDNDVNNTHERTGGVNDDGIARNVLFHLMQAHSKLTFDYLSIAHVVGIRKLLLDEAGLIYRLRF